MPPNSDKGLKAPVQFRSETTVLSKTDALGDQIIAIGLATALLRHRPGSPLVWFVRAGNESIASLLKGSHVYRPDLKQPPASEAQKALQGMRMGRSKWTRIVFIPVPVNPYQEWGRDPDTHLEWWVAFGHDLRANLAVAGSTTRNWLDQVLVASTRAARRVGFGSSLGSQEILQAHQSQINLRQGQQLFTEEVALQENLNERERLHLLAKTVCRKEVPYTITISPCPPAEPIDLTGVDRMLAIAPGVGDPRRMVETSSLCEGVAEFLGKQTVPERHCLIIEGPLDRVVASEVADGLSKRGIESTRLRFDAGGLPNLVALLKQVALFLTHETFYTQIASITGTPTVAIWGLGHWERFFPKKGSMTIVHTEMPCRNCGWRCCLDRWRCITDISSAAIAEGLSSQWHRHRRTGIRFAETPSRVPDEQVIAKMKVAAETMLRETEKQRDKAYAWADDVDKLWRQLQGINADLQKQKDEAVRAAKEERLRRESLEAQLRESQKQCNDTRDWAEKERQLRQATESLRKQAEKQRDDQRDWAEKEHQLRQEAEFRRTEAEKQRDDQRDWAEKERELRQEAEILRTEAEKQRDDQRVWAEKERQLRQEAESLRSDAEKQRDNGVAWAKEEQRLRSIAETLRSDAEIQRDGLRVRVEEERQLRLSAQNSLEIEKKRTLALKEDLKTGKEALENKIAVIENTMEQLAALKKELQHTEEERYRYERLFVCRLSANIAGLWNRATKRTSKQ
jgi:ADP-heptose:LPS heptosyltransferase